MSEDKTLAVEVGKVQQKLDDYIKVHGVTKREMENLERKMDANHEIVIEQVNKNAQGIEEIKAAHVKYKGFLGGILFVFSIIWGVLVFLKTWLLKMAGM